MSGPLSGYTIGVTADRRSAEQMSLLAGRGAECLHGPTVRTHPLRPEQEIREATEQLLADPPRFTVATTGIGMRGWLEAADALVLGEELRLVLGQSRLMARGPKAQGAAITAGLEVEWNAPGATSGELIDHLVEIASPGDRIAVQVDGSADQRIVSELRTQGFDVVPVPIYRWTLPEDRTAAEVLVRAVIEGRVDALTFTARPAVENFVVVAEELGVLDEIREVLRTTVAVFCVGPVCAEGVRDHGLGEPIQPDRFRLGAMVMTITSTMEKRTIETRIGGHSISLQGRQVSVVGETPTLLSGRERQVLDLLMERPGPVVSKKLLLERVWGSSENAHVVEVTVGRLRKKLGPAGVGIETVVRRGYRVSAY